MICVTTLSEETALGSSFSFLFSFAAVAAA